MKNLFFSLSFALLLFAPAYSQVLPNPGFESISIDSVSGDTIPDEWKLSGFGSSGSALYKSSGDYSLCVWQWYTYAIGYARNGSAPLNYLDFADAGTSITGKPSKLSGMYRYDTAATYSSFDSARVVIVLKRWNAGLNKRDTVGMIEHRLPVSSLVSQMDPFEVNIPDWMPGTDPDSIVVTFLSSDDGFCDASDCLYLYVDDLTLTITGKDGQTSTVPFLMYPNPTSGEVRMQSSDAIADEIRVYDIKGTVMFSRQMTKHGEVLLPESHGLPAGIYIVELREKGNVLGRERLVVN